MRLDIPHSPLFWSLLAPSIEEVPDVLGISIPEDVKRFKLIYSRPYINKIVADHTEMALETLPIVELTEKAHRGWKSTFPTYSEISDEIHCKKVERLSFEELFVLLSKLQKATFQLFKFHVMTDTLGNVLYKKLEDLVKLSVKKQARVTCSRLLSGLPNIKLFEMYKEISDICKFVEDNRKLKALILSSEPSRVLDGVKGIAVGRKFLQMFERLIEEYGHLGMGDLTLPRWSESRESVMKIIQGCLKSGRSFQQISNQRVKERENTLNTFLGKLPLKKRKEFLNLLHLVQEHYILRENQHFYISKGTAAMRRLFLEIGKRFQRLGRLLGASDIFFLTVHEIKQPKESKLDIDKISELVLARKERFKKNCETIPPSVVKLGDYCVENQRSKEILVRGIGASGGIATGPARIILRPQDFGDLRNGDVLVAVMIFPEWMPVLGKARAIVTDHGGLLSHGAIIAREFNVPAVVGTRNASRLLRNDLAVTVDGDNGLVIIAQGRANLTHLGCK